MMKSLVAISLLTMYLLQIGVNVSKLAWYELNKGHITELFCVNKDKPELKCHGKCHLKKQVQSEDDDRENAIEISEIVWISFVSEGSSPLLTREVTQNRFTFPHSERVDYDSHLAGVYVVKPKWTSFLQS